MKKDEKTHREDALEKLVTVKVDELVAAAVDVLVRHAHETAVSKGWWEDERSDGELIALMHSELSEALEGLRHGNPPSDHIPEYSAVEEEYSDVLIRIFDHCGARGYRLGEALLAKMEYNKTRPHKHGKKF